MAMDQAPTYFALSFFALSFSSIDFPELAWLPLDDFSEAVLTCHETKDACNQAVIECRLWL
jgi:hypothetical protein